MENCQENNQAMNDILKSVKVRGRIERLIKCAESDKAKHLDRLGREERHEQNHPMNLIKPMEDACRADRLKLMLTILYNDGIDGYANDDDQIYSWLFEGIR